MTRPLTEIDQLVTDDQRRVSITPEIHQKFRNSISVCPRNYDEIDELLDEQIQIDPYVTGTSSRRSDKELDRMLRLIDNLPISAQGKEGPL